MKIICKTLFIVIFFVAGKSYAQDLVYQAKNPAFGGNPYNYSWLLSSAQAQNDIKNPSSASTYTGNGSNPLTDFADNLNRQILSELSRQIVLKQFGENALTAGTYVLGDYQIDIGNQSNGLNITITDNKSGTKTTVEVPYF